MPCLYLALRGHHLGLDIASAKISLLPKVCRGKEDFLPRRLMDNVRVRAWDNFP